MIRLGVKVGWLGFKGGVVDAVRPRVVYSTHGAQLFLGHCMGHCSSEVGCAA